VVLPNDFSDQLSLAAFVQTKAELQFLTDEFSFSTFPFSWRKESRL